ncbi:MAG TPA: signal peptidase I, partial [Pseudogulbenkiania sp.]|nr:signal peptidase I [Pseudogulbenkiania sp.]
FSYGIRVPVLNNVLIPVNKVARGDVVVFNFPPQPKVNYIKRVIGLPGDTVEYRNKRLTVNGQAVPDQQDGSYEYLEQGLAMIHNDQYQEKLGAKSFKVLNIPEAPVLNDVLIPVNKVARGDVVVFNFPPQPKVNYIKRVIGLPGDTVEYRNKRLTVNGQAVPDQQDGSYEYLEQGLAMIHNDQYQEKLGAKSFKVLNIPEAPVLSLSQVADFPFRDRCVYDDNGFTCRVPDGHYFMMGDNRDNSLDGRYWGFVADKLLVGKAFLVWMNFNDLSRIGHAIR